MSATPQRRVELVDPARAAELLQLVPISYIAARLNTRRVTQYARAMRERQWSQAASVLDELPITTDGRLFNGLNRLMAIVASGATLPMTIVTGADPADCRFPADEDRSTT